MPRYALLDTNTNPKQVIGWYKNQEDAPENSTVLEVGDPLYLDALDWSSQGYIVHVTPDESSLDYSAKTYTNEEKWQQNKNRARRLLSDSDSEVIKELVASGNGSIPAALSTYRSDLQTIIDADEMGDPDAVVWPVYP